MLKLSLLKFVRPVANSVFDIKNPYGLKLLTRLPLGISHLHYHKFRDNFKDFINPICVYGLEIETATYFLLHCPLFQSGRQSLTVCFYHVTYAFQSESAVYSCLNVKELLALLETGAISEV